MIHLEKIVPRCSLPGPTHALCGLLLMAAALQPLPGSAASPQPGHTKALAEYDRAIAAGNRKPALRYNRAVTLFKLNRFNEAKSALEDLLRDPQWAALARYNLGLIAEHQQDYAAAQRWYQEVLTTTDNARLQTIAEQKMAQLPTATKTSARTTSKNNLMLISIGAVADDNATGLAEELSGNTSDAKDIYVQSLIYGHTYWSESKLYALLQTRQFQTFDHFDTRVLGAGAEWQFPWQNAQWQYGVRALDIRVDDGELTKQFTGTLGGHRQWSNQRLAWRYNMSHFAAAQDYRHLQGTQHQLQLSWQKKWNSLALEPTLTWEHNNRHDKHGTHTFYSYSPHILTWRLQASWQITPKWQIYSGAEFGRATYPDNNQLTDIGGINKDQKRTYDRTTLSIGTRYRLHKNWQIKLDYQSLHNNDRFDLYSYDKNTLSAKIDFSW